MSNTFKIISDGDCLEAVAMSKDTIERIRFGYPIVLMDKKYKQYGVAEESLKPGDNCGEAYCNECGDKLFRYYLYCHMCGTRIEWKQ